MKTNKLVLAVFIASLYALTGGLFYLAFTQNYHEIKALEPMRMVLFVLLMPMLFKYVLQLFFAPVYSLVKRGRDLRMETSRKPSVSVLIPAWNEEVGIERTIRSVVNTGYENLQVVVINDGSSDGTHDVISRLLKEYRTSGKDTEQITYLDLTNGGKASAMNRGLLHASGEIIMTIDADSLMEASAIDRLVRCFDDPKVGGVAGNVVIANRRKPIEWMQQLEYLYGFFFKRADALFNSVYIIGGAAAAYRRSALDEMGGFDHSIITEDIEMSTRLLRKGYKTRYAADAIIYTEGPSELRGLCQQRLRWKYGRILTFIKHRKLFFSTSHNPYLSFLLLPMAVYAELLLLVELIMMAAFFSYTVLTHDYMPLVVVIALLTAVICMQWAMDSKRRFHANLLLLVPVAWLVFYAMDLVEFQALVRSLKRLIMRRGLQWQKWSRVGVMHDSKLVEPEWVPVD
jgi:cellulose synthase/poly-beta-1,6-N-acetylglucosamine synthase-like glycosyltransferase